MSSVGPSGARPGVPPRLGVTSHRLQRRDAQRRDQHRRERRVLWALVIVAIVAVVAVVVRVATMTTPDVTVTVVHADRVRLPGQVPTPAWPSSGQAAFAVAELGSLGSSGGSTPVPIASVAKVMTAYLVLQHYPLSADGDDGGFSVTITKGQAKAEVSDAAQGQSVVAVSAGEQLNERQLLEALLIRSGDNIAQILAARVSGSVPAFVAEMNATAKSLGMSSTTYTDPSGLEPSTVSTAADQLLLMSQAIKLPVFRAIVSMAEVTLPLAGTVANYDPLIADGYYGKTGSDSQAKGCLAFFKLITVGGRQLTLIGVVLGQGSGSDTYSILDAAGDAATALVTSVTPAISVRTLLPAGSVLLRAAAANGSSVDGVSGAALRVISWGGVSQRLRIIATATGRQLSDGAGLGTAALDGTPLTPAGGATVTKVRAQHALGTPGLVWRLKHLF